MAKSRKKSKSVPQIKKFVLYKYLKEEQARNLMNNGDVYIGTLSYYRDIEDESRADRDEGKKEEVTIISEEKHISNKVEWEKEVSHFKDSNINYIAGNVVFEKGEHVKDMSIQDNYIYCMSRVCSSEIKKKFGADSVIKIVDVKGFLSAIDEELSRLGLIYKNRGTGNPIKYIGHSHEEKIDLSGNWLKKDTYKEEAEFRFCFIPIVSMDGARIEPRILADGSTQFDLPVDEIKIDPISIKIKNIKKYCSW